MSSLPSVLKYWYCIFIGRDVSGVDGSTDPQPSGKAPLFPEFALSRNICGIFYYLPPREGSSNDGSLCFLRIPVDYAPNSGREERRSIGCWAWQIFRLAFITGPRRQCDRVKLVAQKSLLYIMTATPKVPYVVGIACFSSPSRPTIS